MTDLSLKPDILRQMLILQAYFPSILLVLTFESTRCKLFIKKRNENDHENKMLMILVEKIKNNFYQNLDIKCTSDIYHNNVFSFFYKSDFFFGNIHLKTYLGTC